MKKYHWNKMQSLDIISVQVMFFSDYIYMYIDFDISTCIFDIGCTNSRGVMKIVIMADMMPYPFKWWKTNAEVTYGKSSMYLTFFLHRVIEGCFILSIKFSREVWHRKRMYWNRFIFLHRNNRDLYHCRKYFSTFYWISWGV